MMPKLPPPPSVLMPFQIDAVDRWAKAYARAVAEACAKMCEETEFAGIITRSLASKIRKAAEEIGR